MPQGNIDLRKQPSIPNPSGGTSTVYSRSYNIDGEEVLLPSVTQDGRFLKTDDEVLTEYKKTGKHLGKFKSVEEADKYASQLHKDYESGKYSKVPDYAIPFVPDYATPKGQKKKYVRKEPTFTDKVIAEIAKIDPRSSAAFAIRGLSAFTPGGPIGAAAGAGGEFAAQTIEPREDYNLTQIGTQAALGAIPFGRVSSLGRTALKGAALGTGATVASQLAETGELPSLGQVGFGAGLGAGGGAIASRFARKVPTTEGGKIFPGLEEVAPTARREQKLLPSGTYEVTPSGVVRGGKQVPSLREQLGGRLPQERELPDIVTRPTKIEEVTSGVPKEEPDFLKAARERFAAPSAKSVLFPYVEEAILSKYEADLGNKQTETEIGRVADWSIKHSIEGPGAIKASWPEAINTVMDAKKLGIPFEQFNSVAELRTAIEDIKQAYPGIVRSSFDDILSSNIKRMTSPSANITPTVMGMGREEFRRMTKFRLKPPSNVTEQEFNTVADRMFERAVIEEMSQNELRNMKPAAQIPDPISMTGSRVPIYVWDAGGRYTPQEYQQLIGSPTIQKLGMWANVAGHDIAKAIGMHKELDKVGIVINQNLRGITLLDLPRGRYGVFFNPLSLMEHFANNPDKAAGGILHTIAHEVQHSRTRGHNANFTIGLADVYESIGLRRYNELGEELGRIIGGETGSVYPPEIPEILRRYSEVKGRPETIANSIDREDYISGLAGEGSSRIWEVSGRSRENPLASQLPLERPYTYQLEEPPIKVNKEGGQLSETLGTGRSKTLVQQILEEELKKNPFTNVEALYDQMGAPVSYDAYQKMIEAAKANIANESLTKTTGFGTYSRMKATPQSAAARLLSSLKEARAGRAEQEAIYSEERGRRFREFLKVKTTGVKGAREAMSKLRGEHEKVSAPELNMSQEELGVLFDSVRSSHLLTPGEKAHGIEALFKLIDGGHVPQMNEIDVLERVFGGGFGESLLNALKDESGSVPFDLYTGLKLAKTANTMKAAMASLDMSAPLRQGLPLIHRKEYWGAFADMFKYVNSNEFTKAMDSLQRRPNYILSREAGLHWSDVDSLTHGEEQYLNTYFHDWHRTGGKVGAAMTAPLRASERAYVGFLNKLRHDVFDSMVESARAAGADLSMKTITGADGKLKRVPSKDLAAIAKFVNTATGRGHLGRAERYGPLLNMALFSPRLMKSRIDMLTNPSIYTNLPKGVRMEGLKALLSVGSMAAVATGLATTFGGEVGTNPLSSDFGKARFGEQVLDPYGGFQQYIVLGSRLATLLSGGRINDRVGPYESTVASILDNFLMNKLAPMTSLIVEYMRSTPGRRGDEAYERRNRFGQPMNPVDEVTKRISPIITQDLYELISTDENIAKVLGLGTTSFFGMGSQTYPEPKQNTRQRLRINRPRLSL